MVDEEREDGDESDEVDEGVASGEEEDGAERRREGERGVYSRALIFEF